ncbi:hypothetical protein ACU4GD_25510 [Cupriavidus basilensis]
MRNHSATHLMHKALREVLGSHVQQKGSLVDADKTRFDFSHNAAMTDEQIRRVEEIVNAEILQNAATGAEVMPFDDAVKSGAMALFGEKYADDVRVLSIGSSKELCGGTHVTRTGDIGVFKIVMEGGVAAGIRRVEAITGDNALHYLQALDAKLNEAAAALKAQPSELVPRIGQVQAPGARAGEGAGTPQEAKLAACAGRRAGGAGHRRQGYQGTGSPAGRRRRQERCARPWTSSRTSWAPRPSCWAPWPTARSA